jgi:hypothetical protein
MSHISTDRLAAIADDTPSADEATHLAGCWDCRAELTAYRRVVRMAAMAPLPMAPLSAWSRLAPQLRAEGIIHAPSGAHAEGLPRPWRTGNRWMLRAAAGLALVLGGALAGRLSARITLGGEPGPAAGVAARTAFNGPDDAVRVLTAAQQQYQDAAAYLAATQDESSRFIGMNQESYRARLNALDEIAAATRAALYRAPQDPMLNQYYLTTIGAREATLRQIGATPPDTRRMERY